MVWASPLNFSQKYVLIYFSNSQQTLGSENFSLKRYSGKSSRGGGFHPPPDFVGLTKNDYFSKKADALNLASEARDVEEEFRLA